jgi:predicted DNA-binding transcriptional regulator YafY
MTSILARLSEAQKTGKIVRIAYHGGSQPGTATEISPMSIASEEVIAHDIATGEVRTFKLATIALLKSPHLIRTARHRLETRDL